MASEESKDLISSEVPTTDTPVEAQQKVDQQEVSLDEPVAENAIEAQEEKYEKKEMVIDAKSFRRENPRRKIVVDRTEERKTTLSKYLVYIIECEPKPKGVVTVARRYSDFVWLRKILTDQYPALWVPPLPPKKIRGRFEKEFVEGRRLDLERFLIRIDSIDAFGDSEAFQTFLSRPESTFKTSTVGLDKDIAGLTWEDRISRLQTLFPALVDEDLSGTAEQDVDRIKEFLDKCKSQLESLLSSCQNCLSKHDAHAQEIATLTEAFKSLYTVESNYPYCPEPQRIKVTQQFEEWEDFERQQTRLFELEFLHTIHHEYEDVNALIELLVRRAAAHARYTKANQAATKLREKEKEASGLNEKQQAQKAEDEKQERIYKDYMEMATKILLRHEVQRVWDEKVETFETCMANFSETQLSQTEKMRQIWSEALHR